MMIDDMAAMPKTALCQGGNMVSLFADEIECVVRADNVALLAQSDSRPMDQMPCMRPPFKTMWVEWACDGTRYGCYWTQFSSEQAIMYDGLVGCFLGAYSWRIDGLHDEGHYWLWLHEDGSYRSAFSPDEERTMVAASMEGRQSLRPLPKAGEGTIAEWGRTIGLTAEEIEDADRSAWPLRMGLTDPGKEILRIAALTLSLMHCKNVTATEQVPPPALQKARQKRGKRPLFRYHVLNIEPMSKVLRKEGGLGGGNGIAQALHICRGHFKDYRQSGLFGKVKGIFWWDHHIRGDATHGVVAKDYAVSAPTESAAAAT